MITRHGHERGATAIFVVMFASLLFLVITVGFTRIMVQEQGRATDNELSQSAYDAALAGVEDGKRVMSLCDANPASAACVNITSNQCDTVQATLSIGTPEEVLLKTEVSGDQSETFDQAYTCVKISPNTPSVEGTLALHTPDIVHLKSATNFTKVRLSWFSTVDVNGRTLDYGSGAIGDVSLSGLNSWAAGSTARPPLVKAMFIPDAIGAIHDIDDKTVYIYPAKETAIAPSDTAFSLDNRRSGTALEVVYAPVCAETLSSRQQYSCSIVLAIPSATSSAYLYLASMYGKTDYQVSLLDDAGAVVQFNGVQPQVDSTGRAGDIFRRVAARVERKSTDASSLYPRATVDITNNFCKTFAVGTTPDIFINSVSGSSCDPSNT